MVRSEGFRHSLRSRAHPEWPQAQRSGVSKDAWRLAWLSDRQTRQVRADSEGLKGDRVRVEEGGLRMVSSPWMGRT